MVVEVCSEGGGLGVWVPFVVDDHDLHRDGAMDCSKGENR